MPGWACVVKSGVLKKWRSQGQPDLLSGECYLRKEHTWGRVIRSQVGSAEMGEPVAKMGEGQ